MITLDGSLMVGDFSADGLHSESDLFLRDGATFKSVVRLNGAKIDGDVDMSGASLGGTLYADSLRAGRSLFMYSDDQNKASFKDVVLRGAKITGQVSMVGASLDGKLDASGLQASSLYMQSDGQNKARFKEVDLGSAKITGQINMSGASFDGTLDANSLQAGGDLLVSFVGQNKASFKDLDLRGAKITGHVFMAGASFDGRLHASFLQAGGNLFMGDDHCAREVDMVFAHVTGNLDLRGATLAGLDLSGASVAGDLALGEPGNPAVWKGNIRKPSPLNLRNTHIGNLMDARNAWPLPAQGQLNLDGFSFNHLGGFEGETGAEMRGRGMDWWDKWARRDPGYSPAPYAQLAAALTSAGDRDAANEIRYLGRVRECETEKGLAGVLCGALQYVAGFGIGTYTFRVLYWVLGISFLGALYLRTCAKGVGDEKHGFIWCFGASLSRLLPVITINKEFTDFFDDPQRNYFTGWQSFIFSAMGIVGWVLGLILLGAVTGLTQSS
ncbi:MAG: hypothetical protein WA231_01590 [Methylocella sp.]